MKNSLRFFRELRKLTQRELADLTGMKPQTIASYESYPRPLPEEFSRDAAKVLGISEEELQAEPPSNLGEKETEYRADVIRVDIIPDALLRQLFEAFSRAASSGLNLDDQMRVSEAMLVVSRELKRRPEVILHQKRKQGPPSSGLSSVEIDISKQHAASVAESPSDAEGSSTPPGAGAPHPHKAPRSQSSSSAPKPPRQAGGAKDQK